MAKAFDEAAYRASLTPELAALLNKMEADVGKPKRQRKRRRPPAPPAPPRPCPVIDHPARIETILEQIAANRKEPQPSPPLGPDQGNNSRQLDRMHDGPPRHPNRVIRLRTPPLA